MKLWGKFVDLLSLIKEREARKMGEINIKKFESFEKFGGENDLAFIVDFHAFELQ